jgi:signal transduction histidine kinase
MFNSKKDYTELLEKTLKTIETLNYSEQFLDLMPDFLAEHLPVRDVAAFVLDNSNTRFIPFMTDKRSQVSAVIQPVDYDSNLVVYLKNVCKMVVLKDEKESRLRFLQKTDPEFFTTLPVDILVPLMSLKKLYGFVTLEANSKTYRYLETIEDFFYVFSNILMPMISGERSQVENNRNYYKIYRMDRLAMVGELAASAAHEIKNPLAGISTFLRYFTELKDFTKKDIIEELQVMKDSVQRIDEIVKSLLSFSRFKKKKITQVMLNHVIDASLHAMALKIPSNIDVTKNTDDSLMVETDCQQLQQVLINILFNAVEAVDKETGKITIRTFVSGRDQLPSKEMFNIAVIDNGPGIPKEFKEKLFQPFQTTKEEGTGLGLYTCYGLMKSLGGGVNIDSSKTGTQVTLSLPYIFDDEHIDNDL